jgi:hypothetical protein
MTRQADRLVGGMVVGRSGTSARPEFVPRPDRTAAGIQTRAAAAGEMRSIYKAVHLVD